MNIVSDIMLIEADTLAAGTVSSGENQNMNISIPIYYQFPDSKLHGANMGPIWGR